ncbi:MAG: hypothetical protein ACRDVP_08580 [Acidimicrobiales bacterium]
MLLALSAVSAGADQGEGGADSGGPAGVYYAGYYWLGDCNQSATDLYDYDDYFGQVGASLPGGANDPEPPGSYYDNATDVAESLNNWEQLHGAGPGAYFFVTGPGFEPSTENPYQWGETQGAYALQDLNAAQSETNDSYVFPFLWGDIEYSSSTQTNGWTSPAVNGYVWLGFVDYLQNVGINVGAYSSPSQWDSIMGGAPMYQAEWTASLSVEDDPFPCPTAIFSGGPYGINAQFFDPVNTLYDLAWQWSLGSEDYDQIDITRIDAIFGLHRPA